MAQNSTTTVEKQFNRYTTSTLHEKIFSHTDKNTYLAGEIIWFSLYVMEASTNAKIDISKVAYVEILNADNNPVSQVKVELKDGLGNGSVYLPSTLPSGNYSFRAYTSWMKNFSPDLYFSKSLTIFNTLKNEDLKSNKKESAYHIQFFPEGGNLVSGLKSKVAFRAIDNAGKGIIFKGYVLNQKNDTVARFQPSKFGIGTFYLLPDKDMLYRAIMVISGGQTFSATLPSVKASGSVIQLLKQSTGDYKLSLSTTSSEEICRVFIHTGHRLKVDTLLLVREGRGEMVISKDQFGQGISNITVFNEFNRPICERLFFKKPSTLLEVEANINKTEFSKREKVSLNLLSADEIKRPLSSVMSVSVSLVDSLENKAEDLRTFAWLTSELKGRVENPDYYFDSNDEEAQDNLMLTHGWRRFSWEDIQKENFRSVKYLPEVQGHIITGRIVNPSLNTPAANKIGYLSILGKQKQFYTAISDTTGDIKFLTKNLRGSEELILQTNPLSDSLSQIELSSPFSQQFSAEKLAPLSYSKNFSENLKKRSVAMQVTNVFSGDLLRREYMPLVDTIPFYFKATKGYKLEDYVRFSAMEDVLREYVPEIYVINRKKSYNIKFLNTDTKEFYPESPLVLVDGVPVFNGNDVIGLDPLKIRRLEIVNSQYIYGPQLFYGIASFNTYKGELAGIPINPKTTVVDYDGLQLQREFYSPMFEGEKKDARTPDLRNTLYWAPAQKTNQNGTLSFNFYTSDLPGKYKVLIQGLSDNARIGAKSFTFEVK